MENPGVIYCCLHIYPVMLWTILGSSTVVYIYTQQCCGQYWGHLWLSIYISSNAVHNPGVICGVHIYIQFCCGQSWVHLWLSTYISSNAVDNPGVIYGCLHIYPLMLWTILGWLSIYISSKAVDNPGVLNGGLHIYPVMLWTIQGSSMVVYIYI